MRVGIVCPYDLGAPGGVQIQCFELARRLRAVGDDVLLVAPGDGDGWTSVGGVSSIEANGSQVPFTFDPRVFVRMRRAVATMDVVHVHEPFMPLAGWAGLRTGRPTVATFHADPSDPVRAGYRLGARLGARLLRDVETTAVSAVAASALRPGWGPTEIVPNALDVDSYQVGSVRTPKRVVFLGRDDRRKGLDVILDVWPDVMVEHPDADLVVVGASREGTGDRIRFTGRVSESEKREWLQSASIYVAPNLTGESFGIVVAEAMAAGCAVVASDLGAFRHVSPGARFVEPGDRSAWRHSLISLLSDPATIRAMGEQARVDVRRFDWSQVVDRYRTVYRRAVDRSAAPA